MTTEEDEKNRVYCGGARSEREHLLKIVDEAKESYAAKLREHFPIGSECFYIHGNHAVGPVTVIDHPGPAGMAVRVESYARSGRAPSRYWIDGSRMLTREEMTKWKREDGNRRGS